MKYMLLMYANESESAEIPRRNSKPLRRPGMPYGKEAEAAGVLVSNNGLSPSPTRRRCAFGMARR